MKNNILIFIVLIIPIVTYSQEKIINIEVEKNAFNIVEEVSLRTQFLDSVFLGGRVIFKSGETTRALFNYNLLKNCIYFVNEGNQVLELSGLKDIKVIFYGNRTFIPFNSRGFVEVIKTFKDGKMLVVKRNTVIKNKVESRGAYGTSTATSATVRVTAIDDVMPTTISIDKITEVEVKLQLQYFIQFNNRFIPLRKLKDLKKIYPEKWELVVQLVNEKSIKLDNKENVIALINFCAN